MAANGKSEDPESILVKKIDNLEAQIQRLGAQEAYSKLSTGAELTIGQRMFAEHLHDLQQQLHDLQQQLHDLQQLKLESQKTITSHKELVLSDKPDWANGFKRYLLYSTDKDGKPPKNGGGCDIYRAAIPVYSRGIVTYSHGKDRSKWRLFEEDSQFKYFQTFDNVGKKGKGVISAKVVHIDTDLDLVLLVSDADIEHPFSSAALFAGMEYYAVGFGYDRDNPFMFVHGYLSCDEPDDRGAVRGDKGILGGMSGGPLFSSVGELIGMMQAIDFDEADHFPQDPDDRVPSPSSCVLLPINAIKLAFIMNVKPPNVYNPYKRKGRRFEREAGEPSGKKRKDCSFTSSQDQKRRRSWS